MARVLSVAAACAVAFAANAFAGDYPPQDFPVAPLRVDDTKQGGRLAEVSFTYRTAPDLCVTAGAVGDGTFPRARRVLPGDKSLRFRLNAERRPEASLRYWTEVDSSGHAEGDFTLVPIEVVNRKPNGDFALEATLDVTGARYLRLSTSWKGKGFCGGNEFLLNHYALAPVED